MAGVAQRDWLRAAGRQLAAAATARVSDPGRLRLKTVCLLTRRRPQQQRREWRAWCRLCTVGRRRRRLFSGEVAGVRGANVGSRETTATAAESPQCWAMGGASVIDSRLKSTKLPVYRIVPADSLPRPPPPVI